MNNDSPIGIFDSGLGGLTVLQKLKAVLPNENYIYFGDTAHLPYGSKSNQSIIEYSKKIVYFLLSKNVKAIIIACNSASSVAVQIIKTISNIPIFEVITPSVIEAVNTTKTNYVGIIGTKTTINSNVYSEKIRDINPEINTLEIECPLLVPIIEEGLENTNIAYEIAKLYLCPMVESKIDTLILGCTHYPIIINMLKKVISNKIHFISSGGPVTQSLFMHLEKNKNNNTNNHSTTYFYVSDYPDKFLKLGSKFLNDKIINVEVCDFQ